MEFASAAAEVAEVAGLQRLAVDADRTVQHDDGALEIRMQRHGGRLVQGEVDPRPGVSCPAG
ncbi:MAG: hypothetical protein M3143_07315 [Actinomycetota bacterium]|nr:hypothetical protein [Actinomycetota bacterium]